MNSVHIFVSIFLLYALMKYRDRYMTPKPRSGPSPLMLRTKLYTDIPEADSVSPISLMPELEEIARTVQEISPPAQEMNAKEVAKMIEKFAMIFYRLAGKESMSRTESSQATSDLSLLRARLLNAMQSLYVSSRRETHRSKLDSCAADLAFHTSEAVRLVRDTVCKRYANVYAPGLGFPSPIPADLNDRFDKFVS